ncbi:hypothetical protein [Streptomyces syringium]|uniref:hypothetical protein n=1 Tax=Streptomyces syringium TaxID=76729 RepID=UPI003437D633
MAESDERVGNLHDLSWGAVEGSTERSPRQVVITAEAAAMLEAMTSPTSRGAVFATLDGRPGSVARVRFKVAARALRPLGNPRWHEFTSDPRERRGEWIG